MDFVDTELLTPDNGNCNEQNMMISGTIWPIGVNRICGINPGFLFKTYYTQSFRLSTHATFPDQHFYIHFNDDEGAGPKNDYLDIHITTAFSSKPYKFGIWITQINCRELSVVQAPGGCTQYYFGRNGLIKTFNFEGVQYLAGQNYKICIRAEPGACFVGFEAEPNHFMLQVLN